MKKSLILLFVVLLAVISLVLKFSQAASQAPKTEALKVSAVPQAEAQPNMVLVPAGTFKMGSGDFGDAQPVHEVTLTNGFYMGKYEITNKEYADMLNYALSKGYIDMKYLAETREKKEVWGVSKAAKKYQDVDDEHSQIRFVNGKFESHQGKENYPALEVTWPGAAFYCNLLNEKEGLSPLYNLDDWSCQVYGKAGYRLPTEAEWEYAAKFDDGRKYPWGNNAPDPTLANVNNFAKETTSVGTYSPKGDNKLGICDLGGNVAEWCNDWYLDSYNTNQKEIDPAGPPPSLFINCLVFKEFRPLRVIRGGSYLFDANYRKEYGVPFQVDSILHAEAFNNSFRSYDYWKISRHVEGFRVVKTVVTEKTQPAFSAPEK
jgi:formylglycine-generating enzyme required for sulfatase activity